MPIYEYRCDECDRIFSAIRQVGQNAEGLVCPRCGGTQINKVFSMFAAKSGQGGGDKGGSCRPSGHG
ncbi:zinc ribbon domain-containing protein [bacterium]|nr:zinc ribbon domain-containing protein [candidate division CSSED10-310 bacterium]